MNLAQSPSFMAVDCAAQNSLNSYMSQTSSNRRQGVERSPSEAGPDLPYSCRGNRQGIRAHLLGPTADAAPGGEL